MKRVLVTAGQVYGPLDGNKLVGNRVRGIWAARAADYLVALGYEVTFLVPDVNTPQPPGPPHTNLHVVTHKGYWDYAQKCEEMASTHHAAILAAAVVNWIPAEPVKGKMPTAGYNEGDIIQVPFVLAPRVINRMRVINPGLTLIGCKMTIGATEEELIEAAYHVILAGKCNVVVANDMGHGLRRKQLVYQDRAVFTYDNDFEGFFKALREVIEDEHYHTEWASWDNAKILQENADSLALFDLIVEKYRPRFTHRQAGSDRVFGGLIVPLSMGGYLVSPREKGAMFSSENAVYLPPSYTQTCNWDLQEKLIQGLRFQETPKAKAILTSKGAKASLNAPLLMRVFDQYVTWRPSPQTGVSAVLHLHEQLKGAPTVSYAPPGTVRDNNRGIPAHTFNIEGHGFVACLDGNLDIIPP